MTKWLWIVFVVGAVLSWGSYVPTLHEGQKMLGGVPSKGALRAFLCVGVAYFFTAVVIPAILLMSKMEETSFNFEGTKFATIAGALGAAGALCIILSIKSGGSPLYIPALVFSGAPIVNVFITMLWHPPEQAPKPLFFVGVLMAAIGAGLVLYSKPEPKKPAPATPTVTAQASASASK